MNDRYMMIAAVVARRLQTAEWMMLTEADLQKHIPIILDRASGNEIARFLSDLDVCAGVEMFIDQDTGTHLSIQLLVARTQKIYMRERDRLERQFIASFGEAEITLAQEINLVRRDVDNT